MEVIEVVNIKCSECAHIIERELKKLGCSYIEINMDRQRISFLGKVTREQVEEKLFELGFLEADTPLQSVC